MSIKIKELFKKHKEIILYLLFGVGTTAVDWVVSFALYAAKLNVHAANVVAWILAVIFAYVTNRLFVFESKKNGVVHIMTEFTKFSASRVLTLLLQEVLVFALYDTLGINKYIVKIVSAIVVVVLNYVLSKLIVFRKGNK